MPKIFRLPHLLTILLQSRPSLIGRRACEPLWRSAFFVCAALAFCPWWSSSARAETQRDRASAGGYFRIMTRPDFQGGNSRLGLWNINGRLLNEGPWAALELRLDLLQQTPGETDPWTAVVAKVEGGSFSAASFGGGSLANFRATRLYVLAGNVLIPKVTWQVGTLYSTFGDLGLYDISPAAVFADPWGLTSDTVGLSARYNIESLEVLLGFGDSGYFIRADQYNTVFTGGGYVRLRLGEHLAIGAGGQLYFEPEVIGNRFAPHQTPIVESYEDFYRGEVAQRWLEEHPGQALDFPRPEPRESLSYKLIAYLGFGKLGPVRWNNTFVNFRLRHPDNFVIEHYDNQDFTVFVNEQTDERFELLGGNEMQIRIFPNKLDAVWGILFGHAFNRDNDIAAGGDNLTFYSTVLRMQYYVTPTVHILAESSIAQERSNNGNLWREHFDSIFANDWGTADAEGLQFGDTPERTTWQLKGGLVLNPLGPGIYTRPSIRLLYGLQRSNVHNAFGNSFADDLGMYNRFPEKGDRHWHQVIAIEAEGWF